MPRSRDNNARCEALFASALQQSDTPSADQVTAEISRVLGQLGEDGCASRMAQEFGDHPETACRRMQWARRLVSDIIPAAARQHSQNLMLAL
jgi:hypothetical protein